MGSGFSACQSSSTVHVRNSLKSLRDPESRPIPKFHSDRGTYAKKTRLGETYKNGSADARRMSDSANETKHRSKSSGCDVEEDGLEEIMLSRSSQSLNLSTSNVWSKGSLEASTALSDSCDSGIYEGNRKRALHTQEATRQTHNDNAKELRISSNQEGPKDSAIRIEGNATNSAKRPDSFPVTDTRYNRPISKPGTLRSSRRSAPNLMQLAIDEAEEDDEAVRLSRPTRPKTAYVRKRNGQAVPSAKKTKTSPSKESDSDLSIFSDDDFDSDVVSIPDETLAEVTPRGQEMTTVKLGPKFSKVTHNGPERVDWWTAVPPLEEDECLSAIYSARSQSSIAARIDESGIGKKASERSISSVILLSPLETFDPACFSRAASSSSSSSCLFCRTTNNSHVTECPHSRDLHAYLLENSASTPRSTNSHDLIHTNAFKSPRQQHCFICAKALLSHDPSHIIMSHETEKNSEATPSDNTNSHNLSTKTTPATSTTTASSSQAPATAFSASLTNLVCSDCIGPNQPSTHLVSARENLHAIDQEVYTELLSLCQKAQPPKLEEFQTVVVKARPRFLHVISEIKSFVGSHPHRDADGIDPVTLQLVEENLARAFYNSCSHLHPGSVSALVLGHLSALERLYDVSTPKPIRIEVGSKTRQESDKRKEDNGRPKTFSWEESGVEDEGNASDLSDEESSGKESQRLRSPSARRTESCDTVLTSEDNSKEKDKGAPVTGLPPKGGHSNVVENSADAMTSLPRAKTGLRRLPSEQSSVVSRSDLKANNMKNETKSQGKQRPDSGIVVSSSASYSSSEATRDTDSDVTSQTEWIAKSLEMLQDIYRVQTEDHESIKSLVKAITAKCDSDQLKAHALYRWLSTQSLPYYSKYASGCKTSSPSGKMKQLADGKISYASLYQEMARAAGLKCEKIDGYAKGKDYTPGSPMWTTANQHSWNAISFNGHYALIDVKFGSLPFKFFVEHYFMTPPDEFRLSHYPKDKKWLLMAQGISQEDFDATLKVWPAMIAFNIRPLNMRSVLRTYDGRLSITVLLRSVAVTPQLEYTGPGPALDSDNLALNIDQEIRSVDNAETFHMTLPQEGTYFFTLLVHDVEEDEDIPVFQNRIEYADELL